MQNGFTITFPMERRLLRIDIKQLSQEVGGIDADFEGVSFQSRVL